MTSINVASLLNGGGMRGCNGRPSRKICCLVTVASFFTNSTKSNPRKWGQRLRSQTIVNIVQSRCDLYAYRGRHGIFFQPPPTPHQSVDFNLFHFTCFVFLLSFYFSHPLSIMNTKPNEPNESSMGTTYFNNNSLYVSLFQNKCFIK